MTTETETTATEADLTERVLTALRTLNKPAAMSDLVAAIGGNVTPAQIRRALKAGEEKRVVDKTGNRRSTRYVYVLDGAKVL